MSLLVKICGLRDAAGVKAAVAAGADAIGFVFAASPRKVTPAEARSASAAVPPAVKRVAVMRHPSNDEWLAVLAQFEPDVLQTDIEDYVDLDLPDSVLRWPVIREGHRALRRGLPDVFLYEGGDSGKGQTVDWEAAAEVAARGRMILAGGLDPDNVTAAIDTVQPYGVDVSSGVESAPGVKDPERVRAFIQAVRAAEGEL